MSARGDSYLRTDIADVVFCYLRFESGISAHLHLSWLDPQKLRRLTVVGSERMAVFDDMETDRKLMVYEKAAVPGRTGAYGEYIQARSGDIFCPWTPPAEPLRLECEHFIAAVALGGDLTLRHACCRRRRRGPRGAPAVTGPGRGGRHPQARPATHLQVLFPR